MNQKQLLSVKEAASYLRLNPKSLYRLMAARKIPFYKHKGLGYRMKASELDEWLEKGFCPPTEWER